MKTDKKKVLIARARTCLSIPEIVELSGVSKPTVNRAVNGHSVSPESIGRIAKALGVDVLEILADEKKEVE